MLGCFQFHIYVTQYLNNDSNKSQRNNGLEISIYFGLVVLLLLQSTDQTSYCSKKKILLKASLL